MEVIFLPYIYPTRWVEVSRTDIDADQMQSRVLSGAVL